MEYSFIRFCPSVPEFIRFGLDLMILQDVLSPLQKYRVLFPTGTIKFFLSQVIEFLVLPETP